MKNRHLRETVEIIGVISIVASLLLVAWEVRQANRIAAAQIEMQLAHGFNEMNMSRATTPDFARLFPKLNSPGNHLVTATAIRSVSTCTGWTWRKRSIGFRDCTHRSCRSTARFPRCALCPYFNR
jgi:hypothetical protein